VFRDLHVVVTGGSSGLGLELAHRLADEGARITLVARDARKLAAAAADLRDRRPSACVGVESLDVSDEEATPRSMQRIAEANGGIDVLINSAGILREGRFDELPARAFRDVMNVNYFGIVNATRAALPHLLASRGRLVNIASMAGLTGVFGYTPYCGAKHALVGLTEA
jgi:3-dehydrosphinganine reductase